MVKEASENKNLGVIASATTETAASGASAVVTAASTLVETASIASTIKRQTLPKELGDSRAITLSSVSLATSALRAGPILLATVDAPAWITQGSTAIATSVNHKMPINTTLEISVQASQQIAAITSGAPIGSLTITEFNIVVE